MQTTVIDVHTPDGTADAFFARPDEGDHPGVVLFMDAIGMRPQIHDMATRIASHGYVVLAPHAFWRLGRAPLWDVEAILAGGDRSALMDAVGPAMQALTPELATSDAGAWLDELGKHTTGPVGLTGYCFGGGLALRAAATYPGVAAVGSFHAGRLVTDAPTSPHLTLGEITGEVYLGHADNDASMPAEDIATVEKALSEAGVTFTSEVYAGAAHGYTMNDMAVYDTDAAERHWDALLGLLDRTLKHP